MVPTGHGQTRNINVGGNKLLSHTTNMFFFLLILTKKIYDIFS